MRKYDIKSKKYIGVIIGIALIIIIIFSIFLKKVLDVGKIEYAIDANSVVFDADKNMYTTDKDATLKVKWSGNYYMLYEEDMINLTNHSVIYNLNTADLKLYGTFYEVLNTGDVEILKDETVIESSVKSHFYKLDDRKYLIVDRTIESDDGLLVTSNYLLINLDKSGNATLLNNNVNVKTFRPKVLKTSAYTFDISNEILNFGGEDIDLKEIIGSTNQYGKLGGNGSGGAGGNTSGVTSGTAGDGTGSGGGSGGGSGSGSGSGDGTGTGGGSGLGGGSGDGTGTGGGSGSGGFGSGSGSGAGGGSGSGGGSGDGTGAGGSGGTGEGSIGSGGGGTGNAGTNSGYDGNYNGGVSDGAVSEIINATKNTSVIRITTALTSIGVDYVIYDPKNEYQSVYIEIEEANNPEHRSIINLSKNDTNITIRDLSFNTMYNLYFRYTYYDENNVLKVYTFDGDDEPITVVTKTPSIDLKVTGIINNKLHYRITFDNYYTITGGNLNLYKGSQGVTRGEIPLSGSVNEINETIDISDCKFNKGDKISLRLYNIRIDSDSSGFDPNISYYFVY